MMKRTSCLSVWITLAVLLSMIQYPVDVFAQDVPALLDQAKQQVEAKQYQEALEAVKAALAGIWLQTPMGVTKSLLVKQKAQIFGAYEPRENNIYSAKEPIYLYLEPIGYKFKREGELYAISLVADFALADKEGNILGGKKDFGKWTLKSRAMLINFMMNLTYTLSGVKPGEYVLHTTIRDANGSGAVTVQTPVVFK